MAQRSAPAPQGGALCRAVAPVLRAAASLRGMLAPPFRQRAAPPLLPAGRRVDVGAASVLRGLPAAHSAAAAARARHWRARALPGFAGAYPAARRAGRGSPPGDTTATQAPARPTGAVRPAPFASALRAALQGLAAVVWRGGGRVPPAAPRLRSARTWSRAVLAGLRPRSLPFRGGCAPGCAGLAMRLTPPRKGRPG